MQKATPQKKLKAPIKPHQRSLHTKKPQRQRKITKSSPSSPSPSSLSTSIPSPITLQTASFNASATPPSNPAMQRNINRPATGLYRDCLRLIDYMAGKSRKSDRLREIIRGEFEKNSTETDPQKIEQLKGSAVQGLANYLTIESLARAGNKFIEPQIQQDRSLFDRRRNLQQASNHLSLEELQQIEMEGPQEYGGVSISGDFASMGVDIEHVPKDEKPKFVMDLVDDKNKV
jgi:hypothetical protein